MYAHEPVSVRSCSAAAEWLRECGRAPRTVVFVDRAVTTMPTYLTLVAELAAAGHLLESRVVSSPPRVNELLEGRIREADVVLGFGGGTAMDTAKLAALLANSEDVVRRLRPPTACGMVVLPSSVTRDVRLMLVATTLGTGAEGSRSALLYDGSARRLVFGEALRPDLILVETATTDSLPVSLAIRGIVEILLRITSTYVCTRCSSAPSDRAVESAARDVVLAGDQVAALSETEPIPSSIREDMAALSRRSHTPTWLSGRESYSDFVWPLANELAVVTGVPKVEAMAAVTPVIWRRIEEGDVRLGTAERLMSLCSAIAPQRDEPAPHAWLRRLVEAWQVPPVRATSAHLEQAAQHARTRWGGGLPMLRGLRIEEISEIYAEAVSPPVSAQLSRC